MNSHFPGSSGELIHPFKMGAHMSDQCDGLASCQSRVTANTCVPSDQQLDSHKCKNWDAPRKVTHASILATCL